MRLLGWSAVGASSVGGTLVFVRSVRCALVVARSVRCLASIREVGPAAVSSPVAPGGIQYRRAQGWALLYTTICFSYPDTHPVMVRVGEHAVDQLFG